MTDTVRRWHLGTIDGMDDTHGGLLKRSRSPIRAEPTEAGPPLHARTPLGCRLHDRYAAGYPVDLSPHSIYNGNTLC